MKDKPLTEYIIQDHNDHTQGDFRSEDTTELCSTKLEYNDILQMQNVLTENQGNLFY